MHRFRHPLLGCLLFYCLGLWLVRDVLGIAPMVGWGIAFTTLVATAAASVKARDLSYVLLVCFALVGAVRMSLILDDQHMARVLTSELDDDRVRQVEGYVSAAPEKRDKSVRVVLDDVHVTSGPIGYILPGRAVVKITERNSGDSSVVSRLSPGQRVQVTGRVGPPAGWSNFLIYNSRENLAFQRIYSSVSVESPALVKAVGDSVGMFDRLRIWLAGLRASSSDNLLHDVPGHAGALAASMMFNDLSFMTDDDRRIYRDAGTMHLFAVSGMHVVLFAFVLLIIFRSARLSHRQAWTAVSIVLFCYVMLLDFIAPATRAFLMALACTMGRWMKREVDLMSGLLFGVALILVVEPLALWQASFILSVGGVLAVALMLPILQQWLPDAAEKPVLRKRLMRWTTEGLLLGTAATFFLLPLQLYYFSRFNLVAPLANLICGALSGPVLGGILATATAGFCMPSIAHILGAGTGILLDAIHQVSRLAAAQEWAIVHVPRPPLWLVASYYLVLLSGYYMVRRDTPEFRPKSAARFALHAPVALGLFVAWTAFATVQQPLKIWFLDVGQGDSTLLQLPSGQNILVDAGTAAPDVGRIVVIPQLQALGLGAIGTVVVTHSDSDHAGGVAALVHEFRVGTVASGSATLQSTSLANIRNEMTSRSIVAHAVRAGEVLKLDGGVTLSVLNPREGGEGDKRGDNNSHSVVLRVDYRAFSALLMGDAESDVEKTLDRASVTSCSVLKVAHHGSRNGTGQDFLAAVRPELAVISCGAHNRFGHPAPETIERLRACGASIARTDRDGAVLIETRGDGFTVKKAREQEFLP